MTTVYYNEINPKAAASLRELIIAGHIAPGIVDERSIEDVFPSDLRGFTQCHFFAGIGVWSYALRAAGWSDDRSVWTGSCPCQPFSAAGQGSGFDDKRHLWPHWHHLIGQRRPADIFGEQVASKDADPWVDLVQDDLEAMGYAFGAVPFPSAGVGAPHMRDRCYWVANAAGVRQGGRPGLGSKRQRSSKLRPHDHGVARQLGDTSGTRLAQRLGIGRIPCGASGPDAGQAVERAGVCDARGLGSTHRDDAGAGPTNGLWRDADWLLCRDGKWRPVEPGTFPLAHGAPERVGRLHGYGNAINAEAAIAWIETVMEATA